MLRRNQDRKLGAGVPRHAAWLCRAAHLGKGGASPARCIPPEQGGFRAPRAPHDEGRSCPIDPDQPYAGWICGNGVSRCIDSQAFAPDTTTKCVPPLDT
jgi:hypothetical protein